MILEIDDVVPNGRHKGKTIRQIVRYDSGYIKDAIIKRCDFIISKSCFEELAQLTKGHRDNWCKPTQSPNNVFYSLKEYASPYLYDFNEDKEGVRFINEQKL